MRFITYGPRFVLLVVLALTVAVYVPGLNGPYLFDDYHNILWNGPLALAQLSWQGLREAAYSMAGHFPDRGLALVSFALNHSLAGGFDPFGFKLTNVLIHLANGVLVYSLAGRLLGRYDRRVAAGGAGARTSAWMALVVAGVWLLHPLQLTSVLYVVQRMTGMAAFFVFLGLWVFLLGRDRLEAGRSSGLVWMGAGIGGGVGLGFFAKENAVLLVLFACLVEWFFYRREGLSPRHRLWLRVFYLGTAAVPTVLGLVFLVWNPGFVLDDYVLRDFSPWERLLTQARVLFFYLGLMALPNVRLYSLYHDDFGLSTGLWMPWTTGLSVLGWLVLAGLFWWGAKRRALWAFGIGWYVLGHGIESTLLGLELVHEHRNYVPFFGVLLVAVFYLLKLLGRVSVPIRAKAALLVLLVAVCAFSTFVRAEIWSSKASLNAFAVRNHPGSYRSILALSGERLMQQNDVKETWLLLADAAQVSPAASSGLIAMARIVANLQGALLSGHIAAESYNGPAPGWQARELVMNGGYFAALLEAIDDEIVRRLQKFAIPVETVSALRSLRNCIQSGEGGCQTLFEQTVRWHQLALASPGITPALAAQLQMHLAQLYYFVEMPQEAVANMILAVAMDPTNIAIRGAQIRLYIALQDWERVEDALRQMQEQLPANVFQERLDADLRGAYREAKSGSESAASQPEP